MITGYGGKNIPPNSRYYLGGENDVRGFNFYTISPFVEIPFSTTATVILCRSPKPEQRPTRDSDV